MSEFTAVKDSGSRQEFSTGSVRDTQEGKGRFDLISPIALERLAKHYENGARKYSERNWEKGQPLARYLDSAKRHLNKFHEGYRDEDHLAAAAWNVFSLIHTQEMIRRGVLPKELDDLPGYVVVDPLDQFDKPSSRYKYFQESGAESWAEHGGWRWDTVDKVMMVGRPGEWDESAFSDPEDLLANTSNKEVPDPEA